MVKCIVSIREIPAFAGRQACRKFVFKKLATMNIKLTQSGGITGKKMTAVTNINLSLEDWNTLITQIQKNPDDKRTKKDAHHYTLQQTSDDSTKTLIDLDAIPEKHDVLFKKLFDNLKVTG